MRSATEPGPAQTPVADRVYRFGDYELIVPRRELRYGDEVLSVEPKVYDLLLYLLERRDRSVDKNELQDAIWPKVIVTEAALSRCVMKARQAVGDSANRQRVIKTVHSHGYRFVADVRTDDRGRAATAARDAPETERISIAVLPFVNMSHDEEQEFLADGLTQDIITDLSRNSWLFVISHNSTSQYKGRKTGFDQLAAELGVRYLVEGSVRRHGPDIRISAALIDAASGIQEWSERYDQPIADFFEIQDDISRGIAASLGSNVRRVEGRRAAKADPAALDVWGLVHRGMALSWSTFNRESNLAAEALYRQALDIAPGNPRAQSFLATSIAMKVANGWSDDIDADMAAAWQLGRQAIERSPDDAMILINWGHLHTCLGKAHAAVGILEHALELDPSSAWGYGLLAYAMTGDGRAADALPKVMYALRLSPREQTTHWHLAMFAWAYLQLGQYEDAAREAQRSINAYGGWQAPWATLAVARAGLGQWEDAREAATTAARLEPRVGADGFKRFFRFIVRDEAHTQKIAGWLDRIWP